MITRRLLIAARVVFNARLFALENSDGESLIIGTNLGGLGTLIASMASLITYRFHSAYSKSLEDKSKQGNYLLNFTVINIVMLAVLFALYLILNH